MSSFYMLLTFIALPYYMVRAKYLLKKGTSAQITKELKRYGEDFLNIRKKQIITHNEENYLALKNCVFVSNHQSHNDIFILLACLKKPFRFIAKKELFSSIIFKNFMKLSKSYPLDRDNDRASLTVLKQAVSDIENENASVVVFPEGTRSHGYEMNEFKSGLFSMLKRAKTPIIPIYIHNSFKKGTNVYNVYFGEPIIDYKLKGLELSIVAKQAIEKLQIKAST